MCEEFNCTPPELRKVAQEAINNLLPKKSRTIYEKHYQKFQQWCDTNNAHVITENIMLAYFQTLSKDKKSSTLWSTYSQLKACLNVYKNVDISKYSRLYAYLKTSSQGYEAKKSKVLESDDIHRFIAEADDKTYLAMKVVLIIGYTGACRREELTNMLTDDIEVRADVIMVSIPKTKNNVSRLFAITDESWIAIIKKYINLRPPTLTHKRLILTYRNGHCINCPIGINTIGKMPRIIAEYLKLPNPELFTGHCFRRSSVTHLANTGSDLVTIKRHGGWKSSSVAEGYIDNSMKKKIEVAQMFSSERSQPSTSFSATCLSATESSLSSVTTANRIEAIGDQNVEQNFVSTQNLPNITVNAKDTANVTVKVFTNCTVHN